MPYTPCCSYFGVIEAKIKSFIGKHCVWEKCKPEVTQFSCRCCAVGFKGIQNSSWSVRKATPRDMACRCDAPSWPVYLTPDCSMLLGFALKGVARFCLQSTLIRIMHLPWSVFLFILAPMECRAGPLFEADFMDFYNLELADTNDVDHNTHHYDTEDGLQYVVDDWCSTYSNRRSRKKSRPQMWWTIFTSVANGITSNLALSHQSS